MAQQSLYYDILEGVASVISSLSLKDWKGNLVPVVVQKIFSRRSQLDVVPSLVVSRAKEPETVHPVVFGPNVWVWYPVTITTVTGGNRDLTSYLDYYLNWRATLREAFQSAALAGVSAVWDSNMTPDSILDEEAINKNYDIEILKVSFRTSEQRLVS